MCGTRQNARESWLPGDTGGLSHSDELATIRNLPPLVTYANRAMRFRARWSSALPLGIGVLLAASSAYLITWSDSSLRPTWRIFLGCAVGVAALASSLGALVRDDRLASLMLVFAAGIVSALAFILVFSVGFVLLPVGGALGISAYQKQQASQLAPAGFMLSGMVAALMFLTGFMALYRR